MAYAMESAKEQEYMRLTFLGIVTRSILDRALADIYHELIRNGWYKIFVDTTRSELIISPTELFVFVRIFRSKFLMDATIVVLGRPDQMEMVRFIDNIPYNRMDLRSYVDEDLAHEWLVKRSRQMRQSAWKL
jgi:hypothetical protein